MTKREIVLVDMDGVLADFDGRSLAALPEHVPRVPQTSFYVTDDYPEHVDLIKARQSERDFFAELDVVEGAIEGWQRLLDLGYDPVILSAPLHINEYSIEGKRLFLEKHFVPRFGKQIVERAIIDRNKHAYSGLALIDDRAEVVPEGETAEWQHIVFDQPYNQHSSAAYRLHGWNDPNLGDILASISHSRRRAA